ncbi:MAG TPA: sulfatase-like hydrolase/transferase [Sedimentisphaerales bacterium]|nr:sulfatase-like hydrolase/transferase [Sedimentisphaerales bacterium]
MARNLSRRGFLKSASVGAAVAGIAGCARVAVQKDSPDVVAASKPNIVFVLADDLGYGELGCYGQKLIQTPSIDQMAAEGMRFTDHYAGSTVCAPSRCCLMTGLHTGHAYVRGNKEIQPMGQLPLPAETETLPRMLQRAGYTTALIGKWGFGGPGSSGTPNNQGFDSFLGYLCQRHAHNHYPEFLFRNDERVPLSNKVEGGRADGAGVASEKREYAYDLMEAEALEFLNANKDGPFFLCLAVTLPHANNEAGRNGMEVPDFGEYAGTDWPQTEKGRAAMISRLDRGVGRILRRIRSLGIDENTLVFFTSDNGPHREGGSDPNFFASNAPFRGIKRDLYEGGIRVPLIARWPGRIEAGAVTGHISAFWDFLPTLGVLAGGEVLSNTDGLCMAPTLLGVPRKQKQHEYLYWEFHERGFAQAVRMGAWKAVRLLGGGLELYDLQADPGETTNLAANQPKIMARIRQCLADARTESPYWPVEG